MSVAPAAAASLVASTSLSVPAHLRLRCFRLHPRPPPPRLPCFRRRSRACPARAVLEDRAPPPAEEGAAKRGGLNGNGSGVGYDDAAVQAYLGSNGNGNGSAGAGGNGAAVKEKEAAAPTTASSAALVPVVPAVEDEKRRKERVEVIGREDAWFKQSGGEQLPQVRSVCLSSVYRCMLL